MITAEDVCKHLRDGMLAMKGNDPSAVVGYGIRIDDKYFEFRATRQQISNDIITKELLPIVSAQLEAQLSESE